MRVLSALVAVFVCAMVTGCGGGSSSEAGTSGFGSGSGSGGGSGPTTGVPSLAVTLQDSTGAALASNALTGTQNAVAVVQLLDALKAPVANALVTVSSAGLSLTPTSGQTITDANGVARVQVRSRDPFAQGATTLTAASTVGQTAVQSTLAIGLGAATASLSSLSVSAASVPAYQTIQVSVSASVTGTATPAIQYPVSFSATCGVFDPPTATTDSTGVARSAYRNQAGSASACSGAQTLSAVAGSSSVTASVTALAPTPANILFVSATPSRIYLNGSPGAAGGQSLLQFKLIDNSGNPVQGQNIDLTMTLRPANAYLGSVAGTTSLTQPTAADGTVSIAVNAGTEPGPVQVQAALQSNPAIKNVSNSLAIASGLPAQNAFSLSVQTFHMEAWNRDGVTNDITLRIADRLGNPVPDGTTVNLVTEGGQIVASCKTTGAASDNVAACTVVLSSQSPRPVDGRLTVVAWAQGEESFTDLGTPSDNIWKPGEPFDDLGQPYLDRNENGTYDPGIDSSVGTSSGAAACPAGAFLSVPNTCDGTWGKTLVRAQAVISFSGSDAFFSNVQNLVKSGSVCTGRFTIKDARGNPLPSGSTLAVSSVKGGGLTSDDATFEGFGIDGNKVPNEPRAANIGTTHSVVFSNCAAPGSVTFKVSVSTPAGVITSAFFPP